MDREELLRQLRPISRLAKERDTADRQISELERQREKALEDKNKISVREGPGYVEAAMMERAEQEAKKQAKQVISEKKRKNWMIAFGLMTITGIIAVVCAIVGIGLLESFPLSAPVLVDDIYLILIIPVPVVLAVIFILIGKRFTNGCVTLLLLYGGVSGCIVLGLYGVAYGGKFTILFYAVSAVSAFVVWNKNTEKHWQMQLIEEYKQICKQKVIFTDEWQRARRQDELVKEEAFAQKNRQVQEKVDQIDRKLQELRARYKELDEKLMACTVYPYRKLSVIDDVIERLEDMYANTLQEALLQVEEKMRRRSAEAIKAWQEEQDRQAARQRSWEAAQAQAAHNSRMESEARRMADEAKRAADELEEIRRRQEG